MRFLLQEVDKEGLIEMAVHGRKRVMDLTTNVLRDQSDKVLTFGQQGEEINLELILRVVADVGLIQNGGPCSVQNVKAYLRQGIARESLVLCKDTFQGFMIQSRVAQVKQFMQLVDTYLRSTDTDMMPTQFSHRLVFTLFETCRNRRDIYVNRYNSCSSSLWLVLRSREVGSGPTAPSM